MKREVVADIQREETNMHILRHHYLTKVRKMFPICLLFYSDTPTLRHLYVYDLFDMIYRKKLKDTDGIWVKKKNSLKTSWNLKEVIFQPVWDLKSA